MRNYYMLVGLSLQLDHTLFSALCQGRGYVEVRDLINAIEAAGIQFGKDPRLKETRTKVKALSLETRMDALGFETLISEVLLFLFAGPRIVTQFCFSRPSSFCMWDP